eukprot:3941142-Rhodomonas_salina.1
MLVPQYARFSTKYASRYATTIRGTPCTCAIRYQRTLYAVSTPHREAYTEHHTLWSVPKGRWLT